MTAIVCYVVYGVRIYVVRPGGPTVKTGPNINITHEPVLKTVNNKNNKTISEKIKHSKVFSPVSVLSYKAVLGFICFKCHTFIQLSAELCHQYQQIHLLINLFLTDNFCVDILLSLIS